MPRVMFRDVSKMSIELHPRGEMSRCLCKDNTKIVWPFTLVDLFACDVKKVQGDISFQFMYFGTWRLNYWGPLYDQDGR